MGLWWFMLVCDLLTPLLVLPAGLWLKKSPPKQPNELSGYRTRRSRQSPEAWQFAQQYCGKVFVRLSLALLPVTVLVHLFFLRSDTRTLSILCLVVVSVQALVLLSSVFFVERALKRNFPS